MRVRQSKPSVGDVLEAYEEQTDPLILIAHAEGKNVPWVLNQYLSKVGSFRRGYESIGHLKTMQKIVDAFWLQLAERIEGAPEWLEVEVIKWWKTWLDDWVDAGLLYPTTQQDEATISYLRARLDDFLRPQDIPKELP